MSKTVGGATTSFTWDEDSSLPLMLTEQSGTNRTDYVYGPGGLPLEQLTTPAAITRVGVGTPATDNTGVGALSVSLPSGIQAGDQILVSTTFAKGLSNTVTTPSGYTLVTSVQSSTSPNDVTSVFRRTADGTEGSTLSISYSTGAFARAAVAVAYRGVDQVDPIDASASTGGTSTTSVSTSTTTLRNADQLVVFQGADRTALSGASTWSLPTGSPVTERAQGDGGTATVGVADGSQTTAGGSGSLTSNLGTTGTLLSGPSLSTVVVALQTPSPILWYHHDQIGSARALTDDQGRVATTYTYDPYGNVTALTSTQQIVNPFQFCSEYKDAESSLIYLRARYYDSGTAQFMRVDPAVMTTHAPYNHVHGRPESAVDRSGLDASPPSPSCESPYSTLCGAGPLPSQPSAECGAGLAGTGPGTVHSSGNFSGDIETVEDVYCGHVTHTVIYRVYNIRTGKTRYVDTGIPCNPDTFVPPVEYPAPVPAPDWGIWGSSRWRVGGSGTLSIRVCGVGVFR